MVLFFDPSNHLIYMYMYTGQLSFFFVKIKVPLVIKKKLNIFIEFYARSVKCIYASCDRPSEETLFRRKYMYCLAALSCLMILFSSSGHL